MNRSANGLVAVAVLAVAAGCSGPGTPVDEPEPTVALNYVKRGPAASEEASFVKIWQVLGPFSYEGKSYKNEEGSQEATEEKFIQDEAGLRGGKEGAELGGKKWKSVVSDESQIDLNALYDDPEYAAAYLCANLYCPEPLPGGRILLGSDDYIKVWLNGKLIHTYKQERRAAEPDQDTVKDVNLQKGWNTLTIKCIDVVFGWGVYCRIVDGQGKPVAVSGKP